MLSQETTTAISLIGAALLTAMPKLLDYIMGERIARKKRDFDAEEAYRKAVFDDATLARTDRAAFQVLLIARVKELEEKLQKARGPNGSSGSSNLDGSSDPKSDEARQ